MSPKLLACRNRMEERRVFGIHERCLHQKIWWSSVPSLLDAVPRTQSKFVASSVLFRFSELVLYNLGNQLFPAGPCRMFEALFLLSQVVLANIVPLPAQNILVNSCGYPNSSNVFDALNKRQGCPNGFNPCDSSPVCCSSGATTCCSLGSLENVVGQLILFTHKFRLSKNVDL